MVALASAIWKKKIKVSSSRTEHLVANVIKDFYPLARSPALQD